MRFFYAISFDALAFRIPGKKSPLVKPLRLT